MFLSDRALFNSQSLQVTGLYPPVVLLVIERYTLTSGIDNDGNGTIREGFDGNLEGDFTIENDFDIRGTGTFSPPILFLVKLAILEDTELTDLVGTFIMAQDLLGELLRVQPNSISKTVIKTSHQTSF